MRKETNELEIQEIINQSIKRAEWYESTFPNSHNFEKHYKDCFWNLIKKWQRKHNLTDTQEKYLNSIIPIQFKEI